MNADERAINEAITALRDTAERIKDNPAAAREFLGLPPVQPAPVTDRSIEGRIRPAASRPKASEARARGIFERGGGWWIWWVCTEGHVHREKVGPRQVAIETHGARRAEVERSRRLRVPFCPRLERERQRAERKARVPFKEIAQDFLEYARDHKRDQKDPQRMRRLLGFIGGKLAAEITPKDVEDYKAALAQRVSPATVNRDLALLKATFNRAIKAAKATVNPVDGVRLFKENNERTRCLTDEEEARLMAVLPDYLKPFLTGALNTGCRWGEMAALRWDDVDFYTGTIHIRQSKSGEGRRLPMNAVVREALQAVRRDQIQRARDQREGQREILSPLVFCASQGGFLHNFRRDWCKAMEKAKIADFRWHDTRHTAASRLVMAGVDLYTVKEILGHKTIAMTERYAHLSPGHQRQALERLAERRPVEAEPVTHRALAPALAPAREAEKAEAANPR